jgi:hypothetical protein
VKGAVTFSVATLALLTAGCGPTRHSVCLDTPEHVVVLPSTSMSEYETSRELTPTVVEQAARRVAVSCGRLTVGIMTNKPERDLVLSSTVAIPRERRAYNPEPIRRRSLEKLRRFAHRRLLAPLERVEPTRGSPFLATYAKIGRELRAHGWPRATVISIGDGLVVERSPTTGTPVRFDRGMTPDGALDEFVPMLETLRGSCVMLIGQGGTDGSGPSPERTRAAEQLLETTLEGVGVGFVSTRSRELPPSCSRTER